LLTFSLSAAVAVVAAQSLAAVAVLAVIFMQLTNICQLGH
jgi:hypothetical protein